MIGAVADVRGTPSMALPTHSLCFGQLILMFFALQCGTYFVWQALGESPVLALSAGRLQRLHPAWRMLARTAEARCRVFASCD